MSILNKLASSLNRRDEIPNQELAKEIILSDDRVAIKILITNLSSKKAIQNDCIKVLYEIGEQKPELISNYIDEFVNFLDTKNNRLQWGIMTVLYSITNECPQKIYTALPTILSVAEKGSVITKDNTMGILIKLCLIEEYSDSVFSLLIEQLKISPINQLPMYAERAMVVITKKNKELFIETLTSKLNEIEKESKRKRVEKVIKKFTE